jgi:hypothetical protein
MRRFVSPDFTVVSVAAVKVWERLEEKRIAAVSGV